MSWKDLNYKQKAELAKIYIQNGITSLDDMKDHYNANLNHSFKLGGEENHYNSDTTEDNPVKSISKSNGPITRPIMRYLSGPIMSHLSENQHGGLFDNIDLFSLADDYVGPIQNSFLMHHSDARDYILNSGLYIEGKKGDYGLVENAVKKNYGDVPVYQRRTDAESRDNLVPIGNVSNVWFGDHDSKLINAGDYPTAIYIDAKSGSIPYQKAWDLNDYGGSWRGYDRLRELGAKVLNRVGNPSVQTTGIQRILTNEQAIDEMIGTNEYKELLKGEMSNDELSDYPIEVRRIYDDYLSNHGLYYDKDIDAVALKPIEITENRLKAEGGHLFNLGGPIDNNINYLQLGLNIPTNMDNYYITMNPYTMILN